MGGHQVGHQRGIALQVTDQRGVDEARPHRVDADAIGGVLKGCRLRQPDHAVLGRRVGREAEAKPTMPRMEATFTMESPRF